MSDDVTISMDEHTWRSLTSEANRLRVENERLKSGIRSAALTLVKWARAAGGNTSMAIVATNLRELIGEPDLKLSDEDAAAVERQGDEG